MHKIKRDRIKDVAEDARQREQGDPHRRRIQHRPGFLLRNPSE